MRKSKGYLVKTGQGSQKVHNSSTELSLPRDEETQGGIEGGGSHLMVSDRALRRRGLLLDWEDCDRKLECMLEAIEARLWDNAEGHTRFNL